MARKTTLARIDRTLLKRQKSELPEYTPNEIYKVGFSTLTSINKAGSFLYGKKTWKQIKKK